MLHPGFVLKSTLHSSVVYIHKRFFSAQVMPAQSAGAVEYTYCIYRGKTFSTSFLDITLTQSTGAVEYTDWISAEW